MKAKNLIFFLIGLIAIVSIIYSFQGGNDQSVYAEEVIKEREEKDRFMRTSKESPFATNPENYKGLSYFPPDLKYKVIADLTAIEAKKVVTLATNDGKEQRFIEYAYAEFDLDGYHHKLLILEVSDMGPFRGKLFFAFGDETSADESTSET